MHRPSRSGRVAVFRSGLGVVRPVGLDESLSCQSSSCPEFPSFFRAGPRAGLEVPGGEGGLRGRWFPSPVWAAPPHPDGCRDREKPTSSLCVLPGAHRALSPPCADKGGLQLGTLGSVPPSPGRTASGRQLGTCRCWFLTWKARRCWELWSGMARRWSEASPGVCPGPGTQGVLRSVSVGFHTSPQAGCCAT